MDSGTYTRGGDEEMSCEVLQSLGQGCTPWCGGWGGVNFPEYCCSICFLA